MIANIFVQGLLGVVKCTASEALIMFIDIYYVLSQVEYRSPCEDEDLLQHIDELLGELGVDVNDLKVDGDSEDEIGEDDDEEDIDNGKSGGGVAPYGDGEEESDEEEHMEEDQEMNGEDCEMEVDEPANGILNDSIKIEVKEESIE